MKLFRECFVETAFSFDEPLHRTALRDFLSERPAGEVIHDIAASALLYFCIEDGSWNGYEIGVSAVVQFLERATFRVRRTKSLVDLKALLQRGPVNQERLATWARTAFPS